jgi:hypothetical protein
MKKLKNKYRQKNTGWVAGQSGSEFSGRVEMWES